MTITETGAQRRRPQSDTPPPPPSSRGNTRQTSPDSTLSDHLSIVQDRSGYAVFLATDFLRSNQIPLNSEIPFSSASSWLGGGLGLMVQWESGLAGEFSIFHSQVLTSSISGITNSGLEHSLTRIRMLGGPVWTLGKNMELDLAAGLSIYLYSNRAWNGTEELNSNSQNVFLDSRLLFWYKFQDKLSLGLGPTFQYNLGPGYRTLVGINNLADLSTGVELRLRYLFHVPDSGQKKQSDSAVEPSLP
jgi:hypothetical protein